jgi:hypothetical protein
MKKLIVATCLLAMLATQARADEETEPHSFGHKLVMYIPNRVFDLLDIVRARLRIGPGLAAGVRITEPLSVYLGAYGSVYGGLPGPRLEPQLPRPFGLEDLNGAQLSFLNLSTGLGAGPGYSRTEIGASLHLLIIGADVDVDPMEAVDFLAGILTLDPRHDDL